MRRPPAGEMSEELLLKKEVEAVVAVHMAFAGPISHAEPPSKNRATVFLFVQGRGKLHFGEKTYDIEQETIALPIAAGDVRIEVAEGDVLHCLKISRKLSDEDREDMRTFASRRSGDVYVKRFEDCEPYREAIKSPKTTSRTVLPAGYVPRMAMGTVHTTGPDEVGAHRHPMLDQLFLGLAKNDCVVVADDARAEFKEFALLHIPLGSLHGVKADEGTTMYYMWMDFFATKEGEEWLKTHKPVTE